MIDGATNYRDTRHAVQVRGVRTIMHAGRWQVSARARAFIVMSPDGAIGAVACAMLFARCCLSSEAVYGGDGCQPLRPRDERHTSRCEETRELINRALPRRSTVFARYPNHTTADNSPPRSSSA